MFFKNFYAKGKRDAETLRSTRGVPLGTQDNAAKIHAVPKGTDNGGLTPYQALTYLATLSAYLKACSKVESPPPSARNIKG